MLKKLVYTVTLLAFISSSSVFAFQPKEITGYFNGPTIGSITSSSTDISLSSSVLSGITNEEKTGIYFEYIETNLMCIAIYPTPVACLPKKTEIGKTSLTINNLKPDTSYTISYKHDNTIRCITTPCPGNDFQSLSVEFVTKKINEDSPLLPVITKYLVFGSQGEQVVLLQKLLIKKGYLSTSATGYYGSLTFQAVKKFQKDHKISAVGVVGPMTRALLATMTSVSSSSEVTETFEGKVTAYSTACFADGICSISVDGKKIITTIGRSQQTLGTVRGILDFGSIENNVGAKAKVYARKTDEGYTLYGDADYYIEITPLVKGKLIPGSAGIRDVSSLKDVTWVWQKTVETDGNIVVPNKIGAFTVTLAEDGKVSGKTDCNRFFGSYTLTSEGIISFGPLASTLMFCDGSQESLFTDYLAKVSSLRRDESGNLIFVLSNNSGAMYFLKK